MENSSVSPRMDEDISKLLIVPCDPSRDVQRNSLSPISRLPTELLARIFIHNARYSYSKEKYRLSAPTGPSWLNISYVCRRWRAVALNCAILWAHIPTTSLRWTQELLNRSEKAPLKVCAEFYYSDMPSRVLSVLGEVMNHSQRIQKLHLEFPFGIILVHDIHPLSYLLFVHAPCLQHLELSGIEISEEASPLIFEGNTPSLRTLKLSRCSLPWYSFGSNCTFLYVSHDLNACRFRPTMVQFLTLLHNMPCLLHLSLHHVLPSTRDVLSSREYNDISIANLPLLTEFSITAPVSTIITVLSRVNIPFSTRVSLECAPEAEDRYTFNDYIQLAPLLAPRLSKLSDPALAGRHSGRIRSLIICFNPSTVDLVCCTSESATWEHACLEVTLPKLPMTVEEHSLTEVYHSVPLANIQSIYFIDPPVSMGFWRNLFEHLPNVWHIKLSQGDMPEIASVLSLPSRNFMDPAEDSDADRGQNETLVPALEELELDEIDGIRFSRACSSPASDGDPPETGLPADLEPLCDAISAREKTQCRLAMTGCYVKFSDYPEDEGCLNLVAQWKGTQFRVTSTIWRKYER